jgi:predicted Zn-dependent protease
MVKRHVLVIGCAFWLALPLHAAAAESAEERLGSVAAAKIMAVSPPVSTRSVQAYVNLLGYALATNSRTKYSWRFGIVDSADVNAFGLPGGIVLVSRGLVNLLRSEDELAFVLSHEIAHVARQHHYRVILRQRLAEQAMTELAAETGVSDVALQGASAQLFARGVDRSAEFEADRLAVELMTRTGYDPAAALGVLEALGQLRGDEKRAEWLFSTHPTPSQRVDELLSSGIADLPTAAGAVMRTARFEKFKADLRSP